MRTMFIVLPTCLLVIHVAADPARAQSAAKPGVYVSVRASPDTTLDGDAFDGLTFFTSAESSEVTALPDLGSATELGFSLGWRRGPAAVEIGYVRADHNGRFGGRGMEARLSSVDVDFKGFFRSESMVQPFFIGGFGFPWLSVENGSATVREVGDAMFRGGSVKAGGGVAVYVHPRVAVTAGYDFRFVWLLRAKGVVSPYEELDPSVRGRMRNLTIGATFTF